MIDQYYAQIDVTDARDAIVRAERYGLSAHVVDPSGPGGGWPVVEVRVEGQGHPVWKMHARVRRFLESLGYGDEVEIRHRYVIKPRRRSNG